MSFQNFLKKTIDDHLDNVDIESVIEEMTQGDGADGLAFLIKESLDTDVLSELLFNHMMSISLTFEQDSYAYQHCDSCGKPFGDFKSISGFSVSPESIMKHGKRILVIDDL